ncbi:MAG TPA: DMT family transporter [Desulfobacterales bacterium]|jgi:drug/metabolite transporter (DMT)-like permease|nr:DMT family transporter [Desulfobacterales bacterium]HSM89039.1 DMT family transporter [Desulfobacterales bacterium]
MIKQRAGDFPKNLLPYLILSVAPLCWAGNIVLARGVADLIPPVAFAFWRWTLAFVLILPFSLRPLAQDRNEIARRWKMLLLLALLGISSFNTLLYTAVHTTTAINGALIQSTMPAVIVLLSLLLYREKVATRQMGGVALCILGACLIVLRGDLKTLLTMSFVQGDLLMIIAVSAYGLYSAMLRRRPAVHPLSFLAATFALGAAGLFPVYLAELAIAGPVALSREIILSILYVAIFPSIAAYFCWNKGVDLVGPNRAGLFINLIPAFASLLSVWLLGESIQVYHLGGMGLVAGGMFLFYYPKTLNGSFISGHAKSGTAALILPKRIKA